MNQKYGHCLVPSCERLNFEFYPGDIILFEHGEHGLLRCIKEWFLESQWGHVSSFWGAGYTNMEIIESVDLSSDLVPLQVEAIGRGTLKTNLRLSHGRYIKVLRHRDAGIAYAAALRVGDFAREGQRWYDYWAIIRYVVPYLIVRRILRKNCGFGYWRNEKFICSEMVDAAYGYKLFDDNRYFPTLPGDYEFAEQLEVVWEGLL